MTGGAGFIGSALVRLLVRAGCRVRVLDDLSGPGAAARLGRLDLPVSLVQADVRDRLRLEAAMEGAEVVFHLAGRPLALDGPGASWRSAEVNVGGALAVLEAARATRTPRVIIAGSGEVYGRAAAYVLHEDVAPQPVTPAHVEQLAVEQYARLYAVGFGLGVVVLRLFATYGPGEAPAEESTWTNPAWGPALVPRLCRAALTGASPVIEGDPRHTRDLIYVDDAAAALVLAADATVAGGQVVNVAGGEAVSARRLWAMVCARAGTGRGHEPVFVAPRGWEQTNVRVSTQRAARALGWSPTVRLAEGLGRTLLALRADGWPERWQAAQAREPNAWFTPPGEGPPLEPPPRVRWPGTPAAPPAPAHPTSGAPAVVVSLSKDEPAVHALPGLAPIVESIGEPVIESIGEPVIESIGEPIVEIAQADIIEEQPAPAPARRRTSTPPPVPPPRASHGHGDAPSDARDDAHAHAHSPGGLR